MANTLSKAQPAASFRYLKNIHQLSEQVLNENGYYRGFPCVYGHTIRDKDKHWCYECVRKIQSNNCAFDINYATAHYKTRLLMLWRQVKVGHFDDCWESPLLTNKRVRFPSYRSFDNDQYTDNISAHKIIYHCAWGDVGKMFVTRTCKNKACLNPLHLVSSWNRTFPPEIIYPFDYEFNPQKLMHSARNLMQKKPEQVVESNMKKTIQHPWVNKNTPDYDEEKTVCYAPYDEEFG